MKMGLKEMKREYKRIDINKIDDLQDDMEDMLDQANEVQDALGRTYGMPEVGKFINHKLHICTANFYFDLFRSSVYIQIINPVYIILFYA